MSAGWAAKRFWQAASAGANAGGFTVHLDDRPVRTPAKTPLIVPTLPLAQAIAGEWDAQTVKVDPATMPMTRMANSALDKVAPQFDDVAGLIAAYGASDLLCYRADGPQPLVARQAQGWDPLLAWAAEKIGARLQITVGVMPVPQPEDAVTALRTQVRALNPFVLAALHDLVAISGSLVLGLAVLSERLTPDAAWALSRIDEIWQAEVWGADEMAVAAEAWRKQGMDDAGRFLALCRSQSA